MSVRRSIIAVAHPPLVAGGGSVVTAMWVLQALQHDFQLTLLTCGLVDWVQLNAACGTEVDPNIVNILQAPMPSWLSRIAAGDALRGAFLQRMCRRAGPRFDLCISTYNFMDFGAPALQLVADFSWDDALRRRYDRAAQHGVRGLMQRRSPLRAGYLWAAGLIAGGRERGRADDGVIANSQWTADMLERRHGIRASVVFPPVPVCRRDTAVQSRSGDFVLLGRISPEKRVEEAIEVLRRVRARGHDIRLHIIGPLDGSAYARRVERAARDAGSWVELHGGLYGPDKMRMLASHGFGIHMREREAFGIAVAEMVQAGIVPFVPANSAPVEIVADERLTFGGVDDAVERIDHVLRDADALAGIRSRLSEQAKLFSAERFVSDLRHLVAEQLDKAAAASTSIDTEY
jgi:glycosyltransferase involved in cell wall biosynthesis